MPAKDMPTVTTHNATLSPQLGDDVTLTGTIVGKSEFMAGRDAYLVEFNQKGRIKRDWFHATDFEESAEDE